MFAAQKAGRDAGLGEPPSTKAPKKFHHATRKTANGQKSEKVLQDAIAWRSYLLNLIISISINTVTHNDSSRQYTIDNPLPYTFSSNMNFATASLYLTTILTSGSATIGEARRLSSKASGSSKSGKGSHPACRDILYDFNLGVDSFGSGANGYIRTICAGDTFLLTNPAKAKFIYEKMCPNGMKELDGFVDEADKVGGCKDQIAGQPSEAMNQYRTCKADAKVAAEMVCTGTDNLCWSVMYQLQKPACWTADFAAPDLTDDCLPLAKQEEQIGEDPDVPVPVQVTCECLDAYVVAYAYLTSDGKNAFGANGDTLQLVKDRIAKSCPN